MRSRLVNSKRCLSNPKKSARKKYSSAYFLVTFYPESAEHDAPTELSEKPSWDGFWGDSMPTALAGHPGAYFTTIYGGTPGNEYSAQAIVAPPNAIRQWELGNFEGILDFIGANFIPFSFGRANPDLFTPLDFDHHNLDYQLVSSELYGYNNIPNYNYVDSETMVDYFLDGEENYGIVHPIIGGGSYTEYYTGPEYAMILLEYNENYLYLENTLGYLTRAIKIASDGQFIGIKPYCEDGQPIYAFTEDTQFMADLPLFEPLIVSQEVYERLEEQGKVDGFLVVDLRVDGNSNTKGISPTAMTSIELAHYGAKIPLADQFGGFGYPIKNVTLHAMINGVPITSKDLAPDQYAINGLGNLYFYTPVDRLLPVFASNYHNLFEEQVDYSSSEIHYTCVIKIAKVIPDTGSSELSSSALMQSVLYSIMDYMDVYTFGETTANMIAEIGYTQAMTITSTAITAPLLALGAWATLSTQEVQKQVTTAVVNTVQETSVKQASQEIAKLTWGQTIQKLLGSKTLGGLLTQVAIKTVSGVVAETVEEIVIDGIVETFFQSLVTSMGGSADLGHWVSTLMTTARETKFFSSFFKTGGDTSQNQKLAQRLSVVRKTMAKMSLNAEFKSNQQINEQYTSNELELASIKQEATLSLKKIMKAGLLVGLSLVMPSLAGLNLYAITKTLGSTINQAYASHTIKPQVQALATRNVLVSSEALTRSVVSIESLFGEKPVIYEEYVDISSLFGQPSTEVMPQIADLNAILEGLETNRLDYDIMHEILMKSPAQRSAIENNILEYSVASMGGPSDPDGIKQVENMREDLKKSIKQNIKNLESLKGNFDSETELGNIMASLKNKGIYDKTQLSRIEKALIEIKDQMYDGDPVLDSISGKYGAINLKILEVVEDKIDNGEELSYLDYEIFQAKALLENNHYVFKGKYPPLHIIGDWDGKIEDSPYYDDFKIFLERINDVILGEPTLRIRQDGKHQEFIHLSDILGYKYPSKLLERLTQMKHNEKYTAKFRGIEEYTLDVWYVKLQNFVKLRTGARYQEVMNEIDSQFSTIYQKFGYQGLHPLYREARLTLARIGEELVNSEIIPKGKTNTLHTIKDLNDLIGVRSAEAIYNRLLSHPNCKQDPETVIRIVNEIIEGIKGRGQLTEVLKQGILTIQNDFLEKVNSHRLSFNLLDDYRSSYRKKLLEVIVSNCEILQKVDLKYKLAWILMGDKDLDSSQDDVFSRTFLRTNDDRDQNRPYVSTIIKILERVSKWTKHHFSEIGLIVTELEIKEAQEIIKNIVINWAEKAHIFTGKWTPYSSHQWNPFSPLDMSNIRSLSSKNTEQERLIGLLWYVCSVRSDDSELSFEDIRSKKLLGSNKLSIEDIIKGDFRKTARLLKGAIKSILVWIKEESKNDLQGAKIKLYFSVVKNLGRFALTNGISLKGSGGEKLFNGRNFREEYIMAYHVFTGLGKHLGIDPLTLKVVNDKGFNVDENERKSLEAVGTRIFRFLRHHFRDSKAGRISFLHSDIVITDTSSHIMWETLSEADSLSVIRGYEDLIAMEKENIDIEDIKHVFKGNEWIVALWTKDSKFDTNLETFNLKRRDIRIMGLKGFIQENNPIAYERFSDILEKGRTEFDSFLLELHSDLATNDLVLKDVFEFLNTYLRNDGYLINAGTIV